MTFGFAALNKLPRWYGLNCVLKYCCNSKKFRMRLAKQPWPKWLLTGTHSVRFRRSRSASFHKTWVRAQRSVTKLSSNPTFGNSRSDAKEDNPNLSVPPDT